jgi:hypothetical protein
MVTVGQVYEMLVTTGLSSPVAVEQLAASNDLSLPGNFSEIVVETVRAAEALKRQAEKHGIKLPENSDGTADTVLSLSRLDPASFSAIYHLPLASGLCYLMLHNHLTAQPTGESA